MSETLLLHRFFEAQARRTPEAVALIAGERRLTYAELDRRALGLARLLARRVPGGLRPETPVALCLPRDERLIVTMLAVLKAGGLYLPLDPGYPRSRLAYLLDDSRAPLLVTCGDLLPLLPPRPEGTSTLLLEREAEEPNFEESGEGEPALDPDHLAYLIYTSGSTGTPKGVAITHRSAAAMVRWALGAFPPEELAGVLAATSVCFDLSVFEIFVPLAGGGTVVLAANALELPSLPAAGSVTLVNTVPSAIAELLRRNGVPPTVRVVNLAGEALPGALAAAIYRETSARKVYNLYGPSEDTTYSTFALVARDAVEEPPIGRPLPGTAAALLDERGEPVAEGEVGELYLSGAGLARGYLGRPGLTAELFLPDGRAREPGARAYRTGDLARRGADGELRFLGRVDSQVKVRGFRIELGEIEAALTRHPAVREAAVLALPEPEGAGKILTACLVLDPPRATPAELAAFLGATLPSYMVPSSFVALEALPRNPNGKLDRRALAAQVEAERAAALPEESDGGELRAAYAPPQSPVEARLAALWRDVLRRRRKGTGGASGGLEEGGVWRVGRDDSFFHLGGHSLNGTLLLSRLRDAFGVDLQLADLFAAPTLSGLAALVEERAPRGRFAARQPVPVPHGPRLPMSLMQAGVWFASRLDPAVPKFNIPLAFALSGPLAMAPLRAALAALVRRHESLRTRFVEAGGETVQEILPPGPACARVPEIDLTALPGPLGELELSRLRRSFARWLFDLERAPLFVLAAARTGEREHALFLTVHHIVFDGWSERVFWDDLSAYYSAAVAGAPDPLPAPALQFADFSLWQEAWLTPERLAPQLAAWRRDLEGLPPLALPTDRPRRSSFGWRGAVHRFELSPELTERVRAAAREDGATTFMVLFGGFAAVLARHAGQEDFAVNVPVSGRRFSSVERAIGIFTGEVPLRVDLSDRPSAADLVGRLRRTLLDAFARQDLPLDALLRELGQSDLRQRARVFDVGFQVVGEAFPPPSFPGVAATPIRTHSGTSKLELEVEIEDRGPCFEGRCEFPLDLFDPPSVARLFHHFAVLLEAMLAHPGEPVADLELLTAPERSELTHWSRPAPPAESGLLLHQLVELAGARSPGSVAVEGTAGSWSYGELLARSGALARRLRELGAGPESLVALYARRSPAQVAAILAILEAGAAYLPLDAALPEERRARLLEDAAPTLLVTEEGLLPSFGLALRAAARPLGEGLAAARLVPAAAGAREVPSWQRGPAGASAGPDSLAYVLYTSGSTGKPKAVGVPHRAVVNRLLRLVETFEIAPGDAMLHKAGAGFDVAVGEIFAPLAAGARLVLAEPEAEGDAESLAALIAGRGVTLADFVPALLEVLLPHPPFAAAIAGLRQLFVGAETLPSVLCDRLTGTLGVPVANMYGPTEATIDATWGRFAPGETAARGRETAGSAPIGRPFAGCSAFVLAGPPGSPLQPVGVAGELYLGGLCLARGYLGRPELTAEVFLPDPFSARGGDRLYRTGDRCRWRDDGQLEFLDRADRQVKVRGVRIEPAEIEAALRSHPGVRDAVVVARRPEGGAVRLLACVVAAGSEIDPPELRAFLASRLPEALVPADFAALPALPLGANGKLDRRALALLEPAVPRREPAAPPGAWQIRPGLERIVARAFGEVLGHDPAVIAGRDDFFALGGHSLHATRAIWRLRRELGVRLTLRDFFAAPTPSALAARLRERISVQSLAYWRHQLAELPPALELPPDSPRPASPSGERKERRLDLARALAGEIRYLARREAVSPEILLLAAFVALLARESGEEDFLLALLAPASGAAAAPPGEGPAGEPLPFRARVGGESSFLELLGSTRESVLAAMAHRDAPFGLLAAELGFAAGEGGRPVRVAFAPLAGAPDEAAAPPLLPAAFAGFDLALRVETGASGDGEGEIRLGLSAAAELYAGSTLVSLLARLERLSAAAVASPVLPLSALPLLSPAERHQALVEWRGETGPPDPGRGAPFVHERILSWALRASEAPAVAQGERAWSYGELARRAVALAAHLRELGAGPESRVAVCLPRSPEWLLANLSTLLAGAAYVALDPALPADRLEWQLADSGATLLFAEEGAFARRAAERGVRRLTPALPPAAAAVSGFPLPSLAPGNLAYVIYTSGSTGKPKGVELTHGALAHLAAWQAGLFSATAADRCTVLSGVGFDASVLETWPYLAVGAALSIAPDEARFSGEKLRDWLVATGATLTFQPVPLAEELIALDWPEAPALRALATGGDRLHLRPPASLPFRLVNLYGPTECTVISTFAPVRPAAGPARMPAIGRPISGARAYVVDRDGELQAPGAPGELLIGGPGLARGYAGRPELTAASFVPDPFEAVEGRPAGSRLYRTGDLVRHLPSGELEFLGRIDGQVKIRGFRIEPGEVEATLVRHPSVREAAVVVEPVDGGGEERLAAYVAGPDPGAASEESLRSLLAASLPAYMVPARVAVLDHLPRTPGGKVDRAALARLRREDPAPESEPGRGLTPVEAAVAGYWREILRLPRVGAADDFFRLGGHSLLVTRVLALIRDRFGVELSAQEFFEEPTVAAVAAAVESKSPATVPLRALAPRGQGAGGGGEPALLPPLRRASAAELALPLPLSFPQQRLWFLDRLTPGGAAYNIPLAYRLTGPLRPPALAAALGEIVRRHSVLRSRYVEVGGEPRQEIAAAAPLRLPQADLSALPPGLRQAETVRLAAEERERPFDLGRAPLFRALLAAAGPEEWFLLATVHHIAADGWSIALLLDELEALYPAAASSAPSPLSEPRHQYADFALWQRSWPTGTHAAELAFWSGALAGAPTVFDLPADRPRPARPSLGGVTRSRGLGARLSADVRRLARREGVTLYMLLLGAFEILLARIGGREDFLVGSPVANRTRPELEELIGFFVNTLPLRARVPGGLELRRLLRDVRETALEVFAHQDLPFEELVDAFDPERDPSRNPLVQVVFALQTDGRAAGDEERRKAGRDLLAAGGSGESLRLVPAALGEGSSAKFDLTLFAEEGEEEIELTVEAAADLFEATTVLRLLEHQAALLESAVARPGARIADLEWLRPAERHQALVEWGDTRTFPRHGPWVHERVAAQARRAPGRPAVIQGTRRLSYFELERDATRLALRLRALGVAPESRVGVCLQRSPELIVAVLAVLKAGGAFVALDPGHPEDRLRHQLEDAEARILLARGPALHGLAEQMGIEAIDPAGVDLSSIDSGPAKGALPPARIEAENLAYVIFTSGSTGRPKGVELTHGALLNLAVWQARALGAAPGDRTTVLAGVGFDASVLETWPYLAIGATLCIVPEEVRLSAEQLQHWLLAERIALSFLPVPLTEELLGLPWPEEGSPRGLSTGGDRLRLHPPEGLPFPLVNLYGPTEGTVISTFGTVQAARGGDAGKTPSIGRPIANATAWVAGPEMEPRPIGLPGELLVGGAGLARGYLRRPDLTAASFVPDPLSGRPGSRLYRTGDLTRLRADGTLEFLGRIDSQVKIRGYRIELGEIEAALACAPGVREAAALLRDGALVAFVAGAFAPAGLAAEAELEAWLRRSLPDYMVPARIVLLAALPATASDKIDRRALAALPLPPRGGHGPGGEKAAGADDPIADLIAGIWGEVLKVVDPAAGTGIGRNDNFFHLGGHSLLVTRVLSRLREALGVDLPVRALFEAPTVAGLARRVAEARRGGEGGAALPPLVGSEGGGAEGERLPLSFPQQRLWFIDRLAPDSPTYNIGLAFALRGPVDWAALAGSVREAARRHRVLRTRFVDVDGQPWQEVLPVDAVACPLVDLAGLPEGRRSAEVERVAAQEAGQPFALARGPMLRSALVRLAGPAAVEAGSIGRQPEPPAPESRDHVLLLTVHHIASDGESNEILLRELAALYPAAVAGLPSPLPEPPIQYSDYALWQRAWPPEVLDRQLAYWRRQLAGIATLEVATDAARPAVQSFRGEIEGVWVPAPLLAELRALASARGVTLFMTLLAAWQALFHRLTGQTDVAVGSPVANRNRPAIEELVGFFINLLALRTDFAGDPGFGALLTRVRRVALEAYDHADLPFERLVDELSPGRDLSRQPLVQVMFQLERLGPPLRRFGELELEPLELAGAVAKFDLTLSLLDRGADLGGWIEYARDLFDRPTIARLSGQLVRLLAAVAADPEAPLSRAPLLAPGERHQLLAEWNDTAAPALRDVLLHQPFEARAAAEPAAVAAVCAGAALSYGELEARANRLANLLLANGLERGGAVGVWLDRSFDMLAAVLGILKAGGHYLPLEAAWPAGRVEAILGNTGAVAVLTEERHLAGLEEMRWRLPRLRDLVCLDVAEETLPPEPLDAGGVRDLFDYVAERATDRVTAGGFVSAFTGRPFTEAEVDEYRDRVLGLAAPWLRPGARVLEIGSGSGLLLWEMAARGAEVWGVDPSPRTQERNRVRRDELAAEGVETGRIELLTGFAHEIDALLREGERFDLVLLASTVQFFPGARYLGDVLARAFARVAPGGALLVADILDVRRKGELQRAIEGQAGSAAAATAGGAGRELYLDEDQIRDLGAALSGAAEPEILHREKGFANELGYRYDVVVRRASAGREPARASRRKRTWTAWHAARAAASRPAASASPDDLAYVIHTSGSTGEPKGIAVQHRPAVQLCDWINRTFGVGAADRALFVTSLGFDLSVYDVFGLLAAGGVVHVATAAELDDPDRLIALLRAGGITLWDSAPAALVRLAPLFPAAADGASRLRLVLLSGDWIPVTLPDRVRGSFPAARVMALGGATEATVWSNWFPVGEVDPAWPSIPYGRPIANARYHCLDAGYEPCPVGVPGDLYIGGDCLCVGYARRPDLTAAAFVPDPFSERAGERLYRTGDRVRYRTDGNLEFLGRLDSQVKIRGYRIELGEIEIALARLPGVAEAVVVAREDTPGDKRLVAYVVPKDGCADFRRFGAELRDALRSQLPAYMVPADFAVLDHLPVTANGKLDRKALPAPARRSAAGEGAPPTPRTPLEERLAALWREVLGVAEVGAGDNFFELGGHSLLATQLVARMRQTFGVDVPLHSLFQRPTLADLAAEVEAAEPEAAASPVRRIARDGELPLSYSQLRQWFLVQMEPEAPVYNLPLTLRLSGRLSRPALARALAEVALRQESFRTRFAVVDGKPHPHIEERLEIDLPEVDLSALPEAARTAESHRLVQAQGLHPFDLTRLPLLHLALLQLAPEEHFLLFTVHHIVFDGWSLGVFTHEVADLYAAFAAGLPSPLPELAVQYVDYAAWQQEWMEGEEAQRQIAYWRGRLEGSAELLPLPTDRPRPAMQTFVGAFEPVEWPAGLTAALRALGRAEGTTLFMTLLAGFAALLQRLTRQADLNVGTWVANRRWREVEPILGLFVNTLVLRADLTGSPTFRRLLARIKETTVGAFEHQDLPFETLLDRLGTERNLSHTPLFQTMFGLQNFSSPRLELPGLTVEPVDLYEGGRANFDLGLWLWEEGDEITGIMQLNVDLFDRVTVRRWLRQLTGLFEGAAAAPGRRLAELPLLSAGERHQVVHEWAGWQWVRDGAPPRPPLRPVSELIAEQARRRPAKVAVEQEGAEALTYAALEARSDALARRLRALGAGPERVVGLCSVRCPEMVVALLAIQKAGGAYLPLDPSLPAERMAFLLEDAGAVALVVSRHLPNALPELTVPLLPLDPEELARAADTEVAGADPLPGATLDGLAYVLYTSGSTGRPKGVLIGHGALARFVLDAIESYGFRESDRLLQFASLAFDNSAEEIYGTLAAGGTLVLRTEECLSPPRRFLAACRGWGITLLDLPTAYWHVLAGEAALGALELPPALRIVILGGERVQPELIRAWLAAFGPYPQVWNTYGPTEATVMSAGWPAGRPGSEPSSEAPSIPIGRPLPSTRAWLLDPELQPVPMGVAGELHLAGEVLARGYLGRPELTAERFVPSPFCDAVRPGERLYRSGDLARHLPGGAIDFVGRVDDQVKIRGFRVEPGEIASVLGRHPAVRDAAVVALAGAGAREWRLVAYLVANENDAPAPAELRDYLKAHLPAYMVPADYVTVRAFPVTATGKLDRAALPRPAAREEAEPAPPETETEEILAGFWRDLLGRDRVGIYDDFFDLGGHSLLAPQLMSAIARTFEVELPLRVLFEAPTVAQLAVALEGAILEQIESLDADEVAGEWLEAG